MFHPFLFALFPILSLYAFNYDMVLPEDLFLPVIILMFSTLLLVVVLNLLAKGSDKAGILATLTIFLFGSYGHYNNLLIDVASWVPFLRTVPGGGIGICA